ncbi:DUF3473 domain-containing protein [Patescibacteria group bacterium]|nr:DUF3473 domain-containing protein [Patescibacteria group bacterium]
MGQNFPIGGGGYFRVFPYWLIKQGIKKLNKEGHPAVIYMHPYEIDTGDIEIEDFSKNLRTKFTLFTQSMGRSRFEEKIKRLLDEFEFSSIREIFNL